MPAPPVSLPPVLQSRSLGQPCLTSKKGEDHLWQAPWFFCDDRRLLQQSLLWFAPFAALWIFLCSGMRYDMPSLWQGFRYGLVFLGVLAAFGLTFQKYCHWSLLLWLMVASLTYFEKIMFFYSQGGWAYLLKQAPSPLMPFLQGHSGLLLFEAMMILLGLFLLMVAMVFYWQLIHENKHQHKHKDDAVVWRYYHQMLYGGIFLGLAVLLVMVVALMLGHDVFSFERSLLLCSLLLLFTGGALQELQLHQPWLMGDGDEHDTTAKDKEVIRYLLLYDGVCGLCHGFVQFVLKRDHQQRFKFMPLQDPWAQKQLQGLGKEAPSRDAAELSASELTTLYVVAYYDKEDRALIDLLQQSTAVLFVASWLDGPWAYLRYGMILPKYLRDGCYRLVARYRYRFFGRYGQCPLPSSQQRQRFVSGETWLSSSPEVGNFDV